MDDDKQRPPVSDRLLIGDIGDYSGHLELFIDSILEEVSARLTAPGIPRPVTVEGLEEFVQTWGGEDGRFRGGTFRPGDRLPKDEGKCIKERQALAIFKAVRSVNHYCTAGEAANAAFCALQLMARVDDFDEELLPHLLGKKGNEKKRANKAEIEPEVVKVAQAIYKKNQRLSPGDLLDAALDHPSIKAMNKKTNKTDLLKLIKSFHREPNRRRSKK